VARRWHLAAALALAAFGASSKGIALPADAATQLDYIAAPGCPAADAFAAVVSGQLGYGPFRKDASERVIVRIEASDRALQGRIEWRDPGGASVGEQTFPSRSGDCAELARAMGFALALQIQLMAAVAAENGSAYPAAPPLNAGPVVTPAPAALVAPPPSVDVESAASRPKPRSGGPSVSVGAGASAGLGLSSGPVALGRLFAAAEWRRAAVELGAEASLPSATQRADGAGFSQEEFLATLAGCGIRNAWRACAVTKVGELRAAGQGVDVPLTAWGLTVQTGVRLAASLGLGPRAYVVARAEGLARVTRGTVTLDSTSVWTTPRFAASLGIDVGLKFR
jgi:hypothetical protein